MATGHTVESLIAFEDRVAAAFEAKQVRGPIHLCSEGQAAPLLGVFEAVRPEDWVFSTWRSHWHCLLKGVPEAEVFDAICAGRSMYLSFKEHRVLCSAIVGGILPIALGVAMGIQRRERGDPKDPWQTYSSRVWCFVGDMTARTGLYAEFARYAAGHRLPVRVVVENNWVSTNADTRATWGISGSGQSLAPIQYDYTRDRPHTGTGKNVLF